MEYYLVRAMEVGRLSHDNLFLLQEREKGLGHCLMPHEIVARFNLPPLKEAWGIPDSEIAQAKHKVQLEARLRAVGLLAKGPIDSCDVERTHQFDENLQAKVTAGFLDLVCHLGESKARVSDNI